MTERVSVNKVKLFSSTTDNMYQFFRLLTEVDISENPAQKQGDVNWIDLGVFLLQIEATKSAIEFLLFDPEKTFDVPQKTIDVVDEKVDFRIQRDTIIVWDVTSGSFGLSFVNTEKCTEVFEKIASFRKEIAISKREEQEVRIEELLPSTLTPSSFLLIHEMLSNAFGLYFDVSAKAFSIFRNKRTEIVEFFENNDCITQILHFSSVMNDETQNESHENLKAIIHDLIVSNETKFYDSMFTKENMQHLLLILDDKEHSHSLAVNDSTRFIEVIPFSNPMICSSFYRLSFIRYFRANFIPFHCNDVISMTLNVVELKVKTEIVKNLMEDDEWLTKLFQELKTFQLPERKQQLLHLFRDFVKLVYETVHFVSPFPLEKLSSLDYLQNLLFLFDIEDENALFASINTVHFASKLQKLSFQQFLTQNKVFLQNLFLLAFTSSDSFWLEFFDFFTNLDFSDEAFLLYFNAECFNILTTPFTLFFGSTIEITETVEKHPNIAGNEKSLKSQNALIRCSQALIFFLNLHSSVEMLGKKSVSPFWKGLAFILEAKSSSNLLLLTILQLISVLVDKGDFLTHRLLIKYEIFAKMLTIFNHTLNRMNMITSTIAHIFESIATQNISSLISYFIEKHKETLVAFPLFLKPTVSLLFELFSKNLEKRDHTPPMVHKRVKSPQAFSAENNRKRLRGIEEEKVSPPISFLKRAKRL